MIEQHRKTLRIEKHILNLMTAQDMYASICRQARRLPIGTKITVYHSPDAQLFPRLSRKFPDHSEPTNNLLTTTGFEKAIPFGQATDRVEAFALPRLAVAFNKHEVQL